MGGGGGMGGRLLNIVIRRLLAYDNKHSQTISTSQPKHNGHAMAMRLYKQHSFVSLEVNKS